MADQDSRASQAPTPEPSDGIATPAYGRRSEMAIRPVLFLLLLVNLAMSLYQLPLNRVIERRVCREHCAVHDPTKLTPGGSIDEDLCKIEQVQQSLGSIQGVMETIWIVGDFAMTLPLSFIAQRKSRQIILLLNLVSRAFMLSWAVIVGYFDALLPTRAIVVGPMLSVLGGDCVLNSITYALVAELTDDPLRRAVYFGYMSSVSYVVSLLGPALASVTMSVLLWLPFFLGVGLLLLAVSAISTLPSPNSIAQNDRCEAFVSDPEEQTQHLLSSPTSKAQAIAFDGSIFRLVGEHVRELYLIVSSHPRNFSLLLFSFFLTSLASSDTKLLVQYISGKYRWTFAAAGYLLSAKAMVNFVLLTVVVPRFLRSLKTPDQESVDRANISCAKSCLAVSVLGALGIALSPSFLMLVPSLLVYALGSALPIFTLSLLKSPVVCPPSSGTETHIYSIVMLIKTVGSLLGAPLMAALWVNGIGIGGVALGFPYFVSAACYMVAAIVISKITMN
ncbi:MFS efflux pump atnC [Paramyrothecium foliicola]|nr:MFS efflux pump atnC [Paramyrothecium foliicola]